jgi:adenosylmethionine-8-amino-7-oxononanoate aminotransferase
VFFTSGGSDSVDAAWKLVRQFHVMNGEPGRTKAIARRTAYHGASLGALSLTGIDAYKQPFGPAAIPTRHVSPTSAFRTGESESELCTRLLDEIEHVIDQEGGDTIAMLIAEPAQNGGGCFTPPTGYWPGLRRIADRHGILLVADEVITGMGRLGEWFGVTRYAGEPDLITIAKGLTSAYAPMGAVMISDRVAAPFLEQGNTLLHGLTFAGHPLCAAIALKNLEIFQRDEIFEGVRERSPYLRAGLERLLELPIVGDVRGDGFFWALELVRDDDNGRFEPDEIHWLVREFLPARLLENGLIARVDDRGDPVVQIAPPLIADAVVLDELVSTLGTVLDEAGDRVLSGATAGSVT